MLLGELIESVPVLDSHPTKLAQDLLIFSGCLAWIINSDIKSVLHIPDEYGTS